MTSDVVKLHSRGWERKFGIKGNMLRRLSYTKQTWTAYYNLCDQMDSNYGFWCNHSEAGSGKAKCSGYKQTWTAL